MNIKIARYLSAYMSAMIYTYKVISIYEKEYGSKLINVHVSVIGISNNIMLDMDVPKTYLTNMSLFKISCYHNHALLIMSDINKVNQIDKIKVGDII